MRFRRCSLLLLLLAGAVLKSGCTAHPKPPPETQLQVREYQTRTFDTPDTKLVLKAMLNVLQDDGYVVKNAVVELGLITATKEIDLAPGPSSSAEGLGGGIVLGGWHPGGGIFIGPGFGGGVPPPYRKTEIRDFTGNVTEFGTQTKVRVSFQKKILDNRGGVIAVEPIEDPVFYQSFFSRMDKSLYLQKEQL